MQNPWQSIPCKVPLPLCHKLQNELTRMDSLEIISKVDTPTPWCVGMLVVPKQGQNCQNMCGFEAIKHDCSLRNTSTSKN